MDQLIWKPVKADNHEEIIERGEHRISNLERKLKGQMMERVIDSHAHKQSPEFIEEKRQFDQDFAKYHRPDANPGFEVEAVEGAIPFFTFESVPDPVPQGFEVEAVDRKSVDPKKWPHVHQTSHPSIFDEMEARLHEDRGPKVGYDKPSFGPAPDYAKFEKSVAASAIGSSAVVASVALVAAAAFAAVGISLLSRSTGSVLGNRNSN